MGKLMFQTQHNTMQVVTDSALPSHFPHFKYYDTKLKAMFYLFCVTIR